MICPASYVLFNPNVLQLKLSLDVSSGIFERLIIVDNTENEEIKSRVRLLLRKYDNVLYFDLNGNKGIAYALNYSCVKAINLGYKWCALFDQDSIPPDNLIVEFSSFIDTSEINIGVICPQYSNSYKDTISISEGFKLVPSAITSGSLVNLDAYTIVGGFKNDLFIDAVDTEFSWNLRVHGYDIIQLNSVFIKHEIGTNCYDLKLFGRRLMTVDNHNYIRCYYIVRNSISIRKQYKNILPDDARKYKKMLKLIIKVLLFEKDKFRKLRFIYYGFIDAKNNVLGKCSHI